MILLLAGTQEARALASALAEAHIPAMVSLAGAVQRIEEMPLPTQIGGFGGAEGFVACLEREGIRAVIDATHPFAARITARTIAICQQRGLPYLRLDRPAWAREKGDLWHDVPSPEALNAVIPEKARVFLSVGRREISLYQGLGPRPVVMRSIDAPENMPAGWTHVSGKPPFAVADEIALFRAHRIDWLVTKNAGGALSRNKLIAARQMGMPVAMIRRPALPEGGDTCHTVDEALAWAQGQSGAMGAS